MALAVVSQYKTITEADQDLILGHEDEAELGAISNYQRYVEAGYDPIQVLGLLIFCGCYCLAEEDIQLFLDRGVDLNKAYPELITITPTGYHKPKPAKRDNGEAVPCTARTLLNIAYANGNTDAAELLISMGADPNMVDPDGITAWEVIMIDPTGLAAWEAMTRPYPNDWRDTSWLSTTLDNLREAYKLGVRPPAVLQVNKGYVELFRKGSRWFHNVMDAALEVAKNSGTMTKPAVKGR